jgi:DNA-directed RNA polymerase specialized sigma24 family protein
VVDDPNFEIWYMREHARLVASLTLVCGDGSLAADAADEAFARALSRWARVSAMDSPTGWTYRVGINLVRRQARRRERERSLPSLVAVRPDLPAPAGETWSAVAQLPHRQRLAVVLRYVGDLTEADVATVMGVSRGTVASTLADARKALALAMSEPDTKEVTT